MATVDTTTNGNQELKTEDEALSVLMDADIDKVMSGLDRIIEAAPSYEKLFMRWQRQQWNTEDFDFTEDAKQWADPDGFTDDERQFITFGFSQFFVAENSVTVELHPVRARGAAEGGAALPHHADRRRGEARGLLGPLLPRGLRLDAGEPSASTLAQHKRCRQRRLEDALRRHPPRVRRGAAQGPDDFAALVRGVTVYMIVIEGTLALTAARFMIKSLKERERFPGFLAGFTAVNRDESRHVGFGVKFLADAIKDDPENAKIIQDTLKEALPVAPLVFVPPWVDDPYNFQTPFYHSSEIFEYAMKALSKKLAAMGLDPAMLAADDANGGLEDRRRTSPAPGRAGRRPARASGSWPPRSRP